MALTREQAREYLHIIQAFAEGKTIERHICTLNPKTHRFTTRWVDVDIDELDLDNEEYRIKQDNL